MNNDTTNRIHEDADWSNPRLKELLSDFTAVAAAVADAPVALLCVSEGDHERVVANYCWAVDELPSESSLTKKVLENEGPLIVKDMTEEAELANHPLATGQPFIRFVAGFPLSSRDEKDAALLLLDQQPKTLAPRHLQSLGTIASLISRTISEYRGQGSPGGETSRASDSDLAELLDGIEDLIITMTPDGTIEQMNSGGAEHLGFFEPGDRPATLFDMVAKDDIDEMKSTLEGVVHTKTRQPVQTSLVSAYNKRVVVEGTLMPVLEGDQVRSVRVVFRDITDRLDSERELGKTKDAALEAARAKSSFLTNLSHEIRTPLNIVIGMLDLLIGTDLDEEQKDLAETALSNAESFLTVMDNLLHVSKLESGNLTMTEADFDPRSTMSRLVDVTNIMAADRGMKVELEIDEAIPLVLRGDVARVRQVLGNLVSNAVKFNRDGVAKVSAGVQDETPTHLIVHFEVADDGVGIDEKKLSSIFEPFTQVDSSLTRVEGGMGVGLTTAKQLVELMGGKIGVDSETGKGSTFWFTIPFRKVSTDEMAVSARKRGFPGLRALVLDRSETSSKIMEHHFHDWGLEPKMESSLDAAVEELRSQASRGEPYDIFFFDYRLDSRNAFDLAETIRNESRLDHTKLVTMIPLGDTLDDIRLRDAGIDGYMAKPVEQWELFDKISSILARRIDVSQPRSGQGAPRPEIPGQKQGLKILLAEDKPLNQKLALSQLKTLGHEADVVENGQQVLDAIANQQYDVILMDCQMPVLDGYEATVRLRQKEKSTDHHTHVIALTAHAVEGERERCLSAGMDDFLSKPTRQQELARALSKIDSPAGS